MLNNDQSSRSVIERISARPRLAPDRLPVLNALFERVCVIATEKLRTLCFQQMAFSVQPFSISISTQIFERDHDKIMSIYRIPEWNQNVGIGLDRDMCSLLLEAAFGGDGTEPVSDARPFTSFDVRVARYLIDPIASAFAEQFEIISKITLQRERTETFVDTQTLGVKPFDVLIARLTVSLFGREGAVFFYLPAEQLSQFRLYFERDMSQDVSSDPAWSSMLKAEVSMSMVQLQAVLGIIPMTLSQISRLSVGQIIHLDAAPGCLVTLEGSGERLFECSLDQDNNHFVVTIVGAMPEKLSN